MRPEEDQMMRSGRSCCSEDIVYGSTSLRLGTAVTYVTLSEMKRNKNSTTAWYRSSLASSLNLTHHKTLVPLKHALNPVTYRPHSPWAALSITPR
jgi:hypothetical protein